MSQDYYGRNSRFPSSWSFVNNELHDDDDSRYNPSYATDAWSLLNSQDVNEDQLQSLTQNNYSGDLGFNNYGISTTSTIRQERNPSPPPREPEFAPSISSSTKGFIETTYRYQRRRQEDIVGRPDEYDVPPPQSHFDSDIQTSLYGDDSQSIASNIGPTLSSSSLPPSSSSFYSSLGLVLYSIVVLAIGVIIYYVSKDFLSVELLDNIF